MTRSSTNISPRELVEMFFKIVEPPDSPKSFASLRYIKGMPEPLTRALSKQAIVHPTRTVPGLEVSTFARFSGSNVVQKIPCTKYSWCYIGETAELSKREKKRTFLKCQNSVQRLNFPGIPKRPNVFPRSIWNFPRFRALLFVKRARFIVVEESWA